MWQHVNNHAIASTHEAFDVTSGQTLQVTSTHHQMMDPTDEADVLLTARLATTKQTAVAQFDGLLWPDYEAVFYPKTKSFCFQPHPEYLTVNHECQVYYFNFLNQMREM